MKKILVLFLFLTSVSSFARPNLIKKEVVLSLNSCSDLDSVFMYLLEWQKKRNFAIGLNQMKEFHEFYCKTDGRDFVKMFDNYDDLLNKLTSWEKIDNDSHSLLNSMIEFRFGSQVICVYFDIKGNYCINDEWYRINFNMYYLLFKYFSDLLIPNTILVQAKEKYNGGFWDTED